MILNFQYLEKKIFEKKNILALIIKLQVAIKKIIFLLGTF